MKYKELWLRCFPEFWYCQDAAIKSLIDTAAVVEIAQGQEVFSSGMPCQNYLLVLQGRVDVFLLSETGREVLLYQVKPGDSCVLTTSCLLSGDRYPAHALTAENVQAFAISNQVFNRCLGQSMFFREFVFKNFSTRLSNVIGRFDEVVFAGIDARLAKTLLAQGQDAFHITHQDLASQLGSVREVISRHLKQFEDRGWVQLSRGSILVRDRLALQKVIEQGRGA